MCHGGPVESENYMKFWLEAAQFMFWVLTLLLMWTDLCQVLSAGDEAAGIEQLDEDMDDITRNRFTRTHGNMGTISGSDGRFYMEYRFSFPPV